MIEYLSDAVILKSEPRGELDMRFAFFTKKFGKLIAKGKSTRKITSKLAGHLDVGNVSHIRIVEKNGLQVVDALKHAETTIPAHELGKFSALLHEGEPDQRLWTELMAQNLNWRSIVSILGWDPEHALCRSCGRQNPEQFDIKNQEFVCLPCASSFRIPEIALLYIEAKIDSYASSGSGTKKAGGL